MDRWLQNFCLVDTGDRHWSGVGAVENFAVTFANTDLVVSRTTLQCGFNNVDLAGGIQQTRVVT